MRATPPGEAWNFYFIDQSQMSESQTDEEFVLTSAIRSHEIHHTILGLPITGPVKWLHRHIMQVLYQPP